jgi:hypothetical protein
MKTQRQIEYAKAIRRNIVIYAKTHLLITHDELHYLMRENGFGDSLRKLNLSLLIQLENLLKGKENFNFDSLDKRGRYIWSLMKQANWSRDQLYLFIGKKFNKSAIRYLNGKEKSVLIKILREYI